MASRASSVCRPVEQLPGAANPACGGRCGRRGCPDHRSVDHGPKVDLPKTLANATDPQSRIMPTRRGFLQAYKAQVAVTSDQVIVPVQVGQSTTDQGCFTAMLRAAELTAAAMHAVTGGPEHVIGGPFCSAGRAGPLPRSCDAHVLRTTGHAAAPRFGQLEPVRLELRMMVGGRTWSLGVVSVSLRRSAVAWMIR